MFRVFQSPTGGRCAVFQTLLPNVGPGALKNREDPNERAGKVRTCHVMYLTVAPQTGI